MNKKNTLLIAMMATGTAYANNYYSVVVNDFSIVAADIIAPSAPNLSITEDVNSDQFLHANEIRGHSNLSINVELPNDAVKGDILTISNKDNHILTESDISNRTVSYSYSIPDYGDTLNLTAQLRDKAGNQSGINSLNITVQLYVDTTVLVGKNYNKEYDVLSHGSINKNFTYEVWVKPYKAIKAGDISENVSTSGTSGENYIFYPDHGGTGTGIHGIGLSVGTNGFKVYAHSAAYMPSLFVKYQSISSTTWNHFVVSVNNNVPSIYLNGKHVGNGYAPSSGTAISTEYIGGIGSYGPTDADMALVRIWNGALSSSEIGTVYNQHANVGKVIGSSTLVEVLND